MPGHVLVESVTVGEFLDGDRKLVLPWFQRSYAWGDPQIGRLMADLQTAMMPASGRGRYFLGHICLARPSGQVIDQLVDGSQRITTLTILFSILRDLAEGDEAAALHDRIALKGATEGSQPAYRLEPQPHVADFLRRYVQEPGGTSVDVDDDLSALSRTEGTILNNREQLKALLGRMGPSERAALAEFVVRRCSLTVSTVDDPDEAWNMLATEEETGLKHHDADRAKHSLLAPMPRADQPEASRIWDSWVGRIGHDRALQLLGHIRTIGLSRRSTKPIEEDLVRVYRLDRSGLEFLKTEFAPRAAWLDRIVKRAIGTRRDKLYVRLETLSWLDQDLWMAPAIRWLETRGEKHSATPRFFFALDRVSWLMKIAGYDPVAQERRYIEACDTLRRSSALEEIAALDADARLVDAAIANLRSRTFELKRYSDLVLRRISFEQGQDPGPLDPDGLTIEHVLPRNAGGDGTWSRHFKTKAQVAEWSNRLGNLVFLTRADNQLAADRGFDEKRRILANSEYWLARDAAQATDWSAETIRSRTERMIAILLAAWKL